MSELEVQSANADASVTGLTQGQRFANAFIAPSKTFEDIKRGNRSWWLPLIVTAFAGAFLYWAITVEVTWRGVYENQQRNAPEFARQIIAQASPERRAKMDQQGPLQQEVIWALSPLGLLIIDAVTAGLLLVTINFGFGGRAKFSAILAVCLYAGLVLWPIKLILGGAALFAGALPEAFNLRNVAGTNLGYYLSKDETPAALYVLARAIDPLVIWSLVLSSIGVAKVAGTKRSAGYYAVFGWWMLFLIVAVCVSAAFG